MIRSAETVAQTQLQMIPASSPMEQTAGTADSFGLTQPMGVAAWQDPESGSDVHLVAGVEVARAMGTLGGNQGTARSMVNTCGDVGKQHLGAIGCAPSERALQQQLRLTSPRSDQRRDDRLSLGVTTKLRMAAHGHGDRQSAPRNHGYGQLRHGATGVDTTTSATACPRNSEQEVEANDADVDRQHHGGLGKLALRSSGCG